MSCNLVSESLLFLWRAEAFSACTCFLDPMSHGHLQGYSGSGMFAAAGAETGLGWFCGCIATCFKMVIHCCCSLRLPICLLILVMLIGKNWLMLLSLGLKHLTKTESCFQMMSQMNNYQCHLYWCSLCMSCQMGNWAKTQKTH